MKKITVLVLAVMFMIFAAAMLSGCNNGSADPTNVKKDYEQSKKSVDYGNGVYYFPSVQEDFGNALSTFLAEHPDLEVSAMTGDGTRGYGIDVGYFVTFRKK